VKVNHKGSPLAFLKFLSKNGIPRGGGERWQRSRGPYFSWSLELSWISTRPL